MTESLKNLLPVVNLPYLKEPALDPRDVSRFDVAAPAKAIAFVTVKTTGLDPSRHDIVELAVVRVDAVTLDVLKERTVVIRPERSDQAEAAASEARGSWPAAWIRFMPLNEALAFIEPVIEGALVAGHNVGFHWAFLEAGFRGAGLPLPKVDRHLLDTASLAWPLVPIGQVESLSLDAVAGRLGITRPRPYRALTDARCALEVARRLADRMRLGDRVAVLSPDERQICETLLTRLEHGRKRYGSWRVDDGRHYPSEAYDEVLDGLHYVAAELVRQRRIERDRRRRVYVCHPFGNDPVDNTERVRLISRRLLDEGLMPIAPHLFLPQLLDGRHEREYALALCLQLLGTCDEMRVYGTVTEGMKRELHEANRLGLRVHFVREVLA